MLAIVPLFVQCGQGTSDGGLDFRCVLGVDAEYRDLETTLLQVEQLGRAGRRSPVA